MLFNIIRVVIAIVVIVPLLCGCTTEGPYAISGGIGDIGGVQYSMYLIGQDNKPTTCLIVAGKAPVYLVNWDKKTFVFGDHEIAMPAFDGKSYVLKNDYSFQEIESGDFGSYFDRMVASAGKNESSIEEDDLENENSGAMQEVQTRDKDKLDREKLKEVVLEFQWEV